ncbi:Alkaline foam protein B [Aspergillus sclerotialis]|uniref:Alkaline foam protein B n=1 Tax=Aspergillus sclerotialis TaxID=2070753 RepID=A0A3A2Z562_9EURO|nr:Alkaline foam protein B [Aspergillus sclerotialis]
MKTSLIALGALLGLASAQNAVVHNNCANTVYMQSFPYDGSAPGPLTTVPSGETFSEKFRPSGSTIKIGRQKTLGAPLFFGYSFSSNPDYVYYELSTEWGNPFAGQSNSLSAGEGCEEFDCAANDAACYSTPAHKKVYGCPQPVTLTADLCQ